MGQRWPVNPTLEKFRKNKLVFLHPHLISTCSILISLFNVTLTFHTSLEMNIREVYSEQKLSPRGQGR